VSARKPASFSTILGPMTELKLTRAKPEELYQLVFSYPIARRMIKLNRLGRLDAENKDGSDAFWGRLLVLAHSLWEQYERPRAGHGPQSQILRGLKRAGSEVPSALKQATDAAWVLMVHEAEGILVGEFEPDLSYAELDRQRQLRSERSLLKLQTGNPSFSKIPKAVRRAQIAIGEMGLNITPSLILIERSRIMLAQEALNGGIDRVREIVELYDARDYHPNPIRLTMAQLWVHPEFPL
jgi:hypothetical protein